MNGTITITEEQPSASPSPKKRVRGGEALLMALVCEGVDTLFGYPGGAIMPVYDELYHYQDRLHHYLVRHEQGAVHAAQGYARVTNKVGVCIATSGPGATNLITGIADAMIDSTPLVCITGQVGKHLLGTDAFQETDVVGISMPVTKWNYQITSAAEIPAIVAKAFYIARSGRPGPVLIDITKNAQIEEVDFEYTPCTQVRSYYPVRQAKAEALQQAAELINAAQRPYLLAGHGITLAGAEQQLAQFAEKTGIPVACTLLGLSCIDPEHPNYVGYLGMHGNYGANIKTNECDLLIAVGMRFDDRVTGDLSRYAKQAKVIHIEIDPAEINKNVRADVPIVADAKQALEALLPLVQQRQHQEWVAGFKACDAIEQEKVVQDAIAPQEGELKMSEVIHVLSELSEGQAIIVTDVGQHQMEASRYYSFRTHNALVTSGGLGTMGFALPAAIGAKLAMPHRQVVVVVGDGGFQMTLQEMGVMQQYGIAVKILVLNNSFLGMVRQWQELFFERRYSCTEMVNPDFLKLADAYGIQGARVSERALLQDAIRQLLHSPEAMLLEVVVAQETNVFPMIPTGASVSEVRLG